MDAIASQITSLTFVYSTVYSDADQRIDRFKYCRSTALYCGRTQSLRSTQVDPLGSSEDSQYFNQD